MGQPVDFGLEGVDPFGLLGDEHVGVEQLADELGEEPHGRPRGLGKGLFLAAGP